MIQSKLFVLLKSFILALIVVWCFIGCSVVVGEQEQEPNKVADDDDPTVPNVWLGKGDEALADGFLDEAIYFYKEGLARIAVIVEKEEEKGESLLETEIALHTNLATAYSSNGNGEEAIKSYEDALNVYNNNKNNKNNKLIHDVNESDEMKRMRDSITEIAAQAAFFLGMEYQDRRQVRDAVDAYVYAHSLDPRHWASLANLGSVFHDELKNHAKALEAYNKAYAILTTNQQGDDVEPTDPPEEPNLVLSQLQYRIGLCITHDPTKKCALQDDPTKPVDCKEMAAHAFALAVEYDPTNENAKHMLATTTADATMKRASNQYVKSLFDDYASNFEHSLVDELHYTGFERLRRGFDRAFSYSSSSEGGGEPPMFATVVDAGCGTGLVGEQFKNISQTLIGVDLSEAILREAEKARPNLYTELIAGDLIDIFRERRYSIDLIVAADSYIYFGDLDLLFESMNVGLSEQGYLAFTLENVSPETEQSLMQNKPDWKWQLTASGRFAHRKEYVLRVGESHDLDLVRYETLDNFRYEQGVGVRGHLFVMMKKKTKGGGGRDSTHSEL